MSFSWSQSARNYWNRVFKFVAPTAVAIIVLMQVDQYLYQGRYTGATLAVLHRVSTALGIGF
jgi:hypothetical protein